MPMIVIALSTGEAKEQNVVLRTSCREVRTLRTEQTEQGKLMRERGQIAKKTPAGIERTGRRYDDHWCTE